MRVFGSREVKGDQGESRRVHRAQLVSTKCQHGADGGQHRFNGGSTEVQWGSFGLKYGNEGKRGSM